MDPAWKPITAGLRNWRTQTSDENVERFEAVAGELLNELGYSRSFPRPRPESLEAASKIRNSIAQDLHKLTLAKVPLQTARDGVRPPASTNQARETIER